MPLIWTIGQLSILAGISRLIAMIFSDLIQTAQFADGQLHIVIPDDWRQGRTTYGGLTAALAYHSAIQAFGDLPPLRSMQITFVGPVSSDPVFRPALLRRGKNVITIEVKGYCDDNCVVTACFLFGAPRQSAVSLAYESPEFKAPGDCEPFAPEQVKRHLPAFLGHFDLRLERGSRPASSADEALIWSWCRHDDEAARDNIAGFLALADMLPPAAAAMLTRPSMMNSMNWQINFTVPHPETENGWWLIENRADTAGDGYSSQFMRYYNRSGALIAEGTQSVSIFG